MTTFTENLGLPLNSIEESELSDFVQGGDEMSDFLYQKLFDFFCDKNEMPYGTAKARDGDPYEWIETRLQQAAKEIGLI